MGSIAQPWDAALAAELGGTLVTTVDPGSDLLPSITRNRILMPSGALIEPLGLYRAKQLSDPTVSLTALARQMEWTALAELGYSESDASAIVYPGGHMYEAQALTVAPPPLLAPTEPSAIFRTSVAAVPESVRAGAGVGRVAAPIRREIAPVVIGGVVLGAKIAAVIAPILGGLFSIFRGGVSKEVKSALEGMRNSIVGIADTLQRFAWKIANAVGAVLNALHTLWTRVLQPILEKINRITERLGRIIDRVLKPYLEMLERIRRQIMWIYDRYFRPIIVVIETMRRMLLILRLAHVKFAEDLDRRLARLEAKVIAPIEQMLKWTNTLPGWFNVLLTAKYLLQYPIFSNSMDAYAGTWVKQFYNAQSKPLTPEEQAAMAAVRPAKPVPVLLAELRDYLTAGAGPLAMPTNEALARLRGYLGG